MSKTKEELSAIKEEVEAVNEKLQELTPEEIAQVSGGIDTTTDRHGRWRQPGTEGYSGMGPRDI